MVSSLEGWSFTRPKGIDDPAADHAMIQPMFQVKLVQQSGKPLRRCSTVLARERAPPIRRLPGNVAPEAGEQPALRSSPPGARARHRRRDASSPMSRSRSPRASSSASSARTAQARPRSSTCSRGSSGRRAAGSCSRVGTSPECAPTGGRSAGLGRTFQVSSVFPLLTVGENVRLAAEARIGGALNVVRRAARFRPRSSGRLQRSSRWGSLRASPRRPGSSRTGTSGSSRSRCCSPVTPA